MECIQLSLFGKTYPEHSVPTEEKISEPCWKNLPALNSQTFQFLDLGGQRAAEILFERTSLSGHPDEGIKAWEATPGSSQASPYGRDRGGQFLHPENP